MNFTIDNYRISDVEHDTFQLILEKLISVEASSYVMYANAYTFLLARKFIWLKELNNSADLVLVDGYGIVWAAKLLFGRNPSLVTLTYQNIIIAKACVSTNKSIYLLGGESGVAELAANKLKNEVPELCIAGLHHGYIHNDCSESQKVITNIQNSGAGVLILGMGSPTQEQWYLEHRDQLNGITCIMGGNCLTYWAGLDSKPPDFMTRNGLAWLHRVFQHPIRLLPRYLTVIPTFVAQILLLKAKQLLRGH